MFCPTAPLAFALPEVTVLPELAPEPPVEQPVIAASATSVSESAAAKATARVNEGRLKRVVMGFRQLSPCLSMLL
jgi:hypothetical protein